MDDPNEKAVAIDIMDSSVDEALEAKEGYVLDVALYENNGLKTAADGRTVLIPQPTNDPDDPFNWPQLKKLSILFVITFIAFLPDFNSATGVPALIPQSLQWQLSPNTIQYKLVGQCAALGICAVLTAILSNYFGRLPVLLAFQVLGFATAVWCAVAQSFHSYLAARILTGFGIVAQAGGMMFIKDMFFFHEHPRMINIWSGGVIVSPYLGPLVESFITWKTSWRWGFWVHTILSAVALILLVLVCDETWYSRSKQTGSRGPRQGHVPRLLGVAQWPAMRESGATLTRALSRPFIAISKLPVLLCVIYYFINFAWVIGVNATTSVWLSSLYGFNGKYLGLFYLAGIIGTVFGEVAGHWLHDGIATYYARRHGGRIEAEVRLYAAYLASAIMIVAVVILGFALQNVWHYMVVAVCYGTQVVGIMIATTAVNAYLLDSYPEGSGEVGAWIVFGRTFGGFMATLIEIPWVTKTGAARVFGVQAGTISAAALILVFLQIFGKRIRKAQRGMVFLS
ncbi:hypothetical protein B0A55_01070 [Friedmanniomyces simplex]|uniref:Major facilitator superfamily (MFS) profile domain-containing protein n=1 Tax=Friedmanniomyces simplex TaxID=329884 RepID=A0A4U0Y0I1_9PEZI|nr:hypothetical protein B0A55_01070 [Friedmanniomyces simplex]